MIFSWELPSYFRLPHHPHHACTVQANQGDGPQSWNFKGFTLWFMIQPGIQLYYGIWKSILWYIMHVMEKNIMHNIYIYTIIYNCGQLWDLASACIPASSASARNSARAVCLVDAKCNAVRPRTSHGQGHQKRLESVRVVEWSLTNQQHINSGKLTYL